MSVGRRLLPVRLDGGTARMLFQLAWNALALAAVVLGPAYLIRHTFVWKDPPAGIAHALLMGCAFLALALFLSVAARRFGRGLLAVAGLAAAAGCMGGAFLVLHYEPDLRYGGTRELLLAALGVPIARVPYMNRRGGLAIALLVAGLGVWLAGRSATEHRSLETALKNLSITTFAHVVDAGSTGGGAIAPHGESLLLIAGDGAIHQLTPSADGEVMRSTRLAGSVPLDRTGLTPAPLHPDREPRLLVTGVVLEPVADLPRVWVAHQYWNTAGKCFTIRVSVRRLDLKALADGHESDGWTALYESRPCLTLTNRFDDFETGGRLAWLNGKLLLTLGDHGFDGRTGPAVSQTHDSAYGKVIRINPVSGTNDIFTLGHRNPQGLHVDPGGKIWLTEHGPRGGDEINRLEPGRNYGWPLATYGTDYDSFAWPLAPDTRDHGALAEPVHVFVPSIGISNLIRVTSVLFPEWRDDLLVASLGAKSLFRVRIRGDVVTYVEPIPIGNRIRDLTEGPGGRIFLWTDEGDVVVID